MKKFNHKKILEQINSKFPNLHTKYLGEGISDIWTDKGESDLIGTIEAKPATRIQFYTVCLTFHLREDVLDFVIKQYTEQKEAISAKKQGFNAFIEDRLRQVITLI